ncbi:hypothetical protein [Deinococcus enclensis]|uniref:Uncharacterized protein n=1 Tax=Deinococcus enclensis TaxID=1049582 RepID=A0ABT9MFQ1_9DEIO|nr:hypothetical protein [Deinococcus enclensis]MDP9765438.1 hypothetical protein [Deinococcus enclensis]
MTEPAPATPDLMALLAELRALTEEAAGPAPTRALLALPHVCAELLHAMHGRDFRAFVVTGDDIPAFSRLFHALYPVTPLTTGTGEGREP